MLSDMIRQEIRLLISLLQEALGPSPTELGARPRQQAEVCWAWCAHRVLSVHGVASGSREPEKLDVSEPWES